jgi:4-amino-4-deoxy-L-arabinose transferase-like glycosyltransferase
MALQTPDKPRLYAGPPPEGGDDAPRSPNRIVPAEHQTTPPLTAVDVLWLLVAILVSLALRVPFFNVPMIHDEGGYAYAARGWFEGTGRLYDDLWISRPQGIFLLYGAVFELLGEGVWAFRFAAWVFVALTVAAVWLMGRRWSTPAVANTAAVLVAIVSSLPNLEGFTANAEIFMGLPAAFAAFWLLRQQQEGWSTWQLGGVGALIGLATLLKPSGITMLFVAVAFLLLVAEGTLSDRLRLCAAVVGGIVAVAIPTLIHGYTLGWHDFLYATITYRLTMQSSATVGIGHHVHAIASLAGKIAPLLVLAGVVLALRYRSQLRQPRYWRTIPAQVWSFSAHAPASLFTYHPVPPFRLIRPDDAAGTLIRLWGLGALAGIALGGDWWSHYLIQVAPPFALWLAYNLSVLSHTLTRWWRPVLVVATTVLLLLPFNVLIGSRDGLTQRLYGHPGYPAQAAVAQYLQEHVDPDRTIYVAFDQAAIYYLADRKPAYRHLYDQELQALPSAYADIIAIIRSPNRPQYIVSTLHPGPFPDDSRAFWREVGMYYDVETTIGGVPIYREKPASELPVESGG